MSNLPLIPFLRGCLAAVAEGDAIGLPWEIKTAELIFAETGGRGVLGVTAIPDDHAFASLRGLPLGSTSDDWGTTGGTVRAFLSCRDPSAPAFRHIVAREYAHELLLTGGKGWGKGTKAAIIDMDEWLRGIPGHRSPVDPVVPTAGVGSANGVAMRIAGYGIVHGVWRMARPLAVDVVENGRMTHGDLRASVAAFAVAETIRSIVACHAAGESPERIADRFRSLAPLVELIDAVSGLESDLRLEPTVSRALSRLREPGVLSSAASLRRTVGTSTLCWESVPFSIGTFLRHADDPRAAILEAVNAGGDTDSNAAIVGAMVGLLNGIDALPCEWLEAVPAAREAIGLSERLAA